ncbi:hypothetical protein L484_005793 [Morus notabilis]|uniref:LOB domain-containing protein n=1 Tax=Morus notabilis TaxID=981085 RepID=W9S930_9ROSA|nr:hypothetical protein L484_005793 [Morus notabilis]
MISGRCAACKNSRSKCPPNCIFSPFFPSNNPQRFACVHRIYGAKNVKKMLQALPSHDLRAQAAECMCFEAQCRIESPVYGCGGIVSQLHQQIHFAETQLAKTRAQIKALIISNVVQEEESQLLHDQPLG